MSDTDYKKSAGTQNGGQPQPWDRQPVNRRTKGDTNMNDTDYKESAGTQDGDQPQPWDQQPGEPADCYYWFRIYLLMPLPRKVAQVAKQVGTNSERTWMSKIARKWRWKERAMHFDADKAERFVIRAEIGEQLLQEKFFAALFHGLLDTTRAIENAEIDRLDRDEARGYFSPIARHQRGLLSITAQQSEQTSEESLEELNQARLAELVEERALAMVDEPDERLEKMIALCYGSDEELAETCSDTEEAG
ncbi:MAG: hypothetical protein OXH98_07225 [Caldilineaceae bacterium]|nr:hypothetical protein [Caldilineaceae bacterium]